MIHEEVYKPYNWFTTLAGIEASEFKDIINKYELKVNRENSLYPVAKILRIINEQRKTKDARRTFNLAQLEEVKRVEEIQKLRLYNGEKSGLLIKRTYAKERVRLVFQSVVSKIKYAIKNLSPRLVGLESARTIEQVITKAWNGAIQELEEQSKCVDWENDEMVIKMQTSKPITQYNLKKDEDEDLVYKSFDSLYENSPRINDTELIDR